MRKIFVLGANSFSGQDFVDALLETTDDRIFGISRSPERSEVFLRYRKRADLSRYSYHQIDLNRQMEELKTLLAREKPSVIVNFAAQSEVAPSWDHPEDWFETNCVALARLVNVLRHADTLEKYLHISSPEVYGSCSGTVTEDAPCRPSTPYAASKAAADMLLATYCRQFDFPLLTVRATNVYGAGQQLFKIIPRSIISIRRGSQILLHGGGKAIKSYIHIRDVSRGELAILEHGRTGEIYHLSPDQGVAVRDVVEKIALQMGHRLDEVATGVDERPGQDAAYVIDSSKARNAFAWKPSIDLDAGLQEVIAWVSDNWAEISNAETEYIHKP